MRRRTSHVIAVALLLGASSANLAGAASASEFALSPGAAIRKYAPMVWIAPGERHFPIGANKVMVAASLRWGHDSECPDTPVARGSGDWRAFAANLGAGKYVASTQDAECVVEPGRDHQYDSNQWTRPYDDGRPRLGESREGFYLNIPIALYDGASPAHAPVYWEFENRDHVTYWFLHAFNHADGSNWDETLGNHQGDWERVTVKLNDQNRAVKVAYFTHNTYCTVAWASVGKHHGHPVVFSARGSHASYRTADRHDRAFPEYDDFTGKGTRWRTYNNLRKLAAQPWYRNGSYGGGWGLAAPEPGNPIIRELRVARLMTGPLGPSAYKLGTVDDWGKECDLSG